MLVWKRCQTLSCRGFTASGWQLVINREWIGGVRVHCTFESHANAHLRLKGTVQYIHMDNSKRKAFFTMKFHCRSRCLETQDLQHIVVIPQKLQLFKGTFSAGNMAARYAGRVSGAIGAASIFFSPYAVQRGWLTEMSPYPLAYEYWIHGTWILDSWRPHIYI